MDSTFIIDKNACVDNFMKNLNVQRNNKQFCDITLKSNDGETFLVHKIVICASSSFFKTLFNSNFCDKESDIIELSKIPSDVLKILIEFMYGEKIIIQKIKIRNVLNGALFLGLYNLVDNCTQALIKTIDKTNKFELINYAETYINIHGEKLLKECLKFILNADDFQTVIKSEDFLQSSFDAIRILVSIERNDSINEEDLYLSLIEWISFDIVNREQYLNSLINEIHFDQISNAFLLKIYKTYDNLRNNNDFLKKMLAITSFLNCNKTESLSLQKDKTNKTKYFNLSPINGNIYAVFDNEMVILDPYTMDFSRFIATIDCENFGYTNFKNQGIFLCGGGLNDGLSSKSCKYFSFHTNQFHELIPMQYTRFGHGAITLNDQIYVCGGDETKTSIEIFDLNAIYWRNGCSLNKGYSNFGLCTLDGSIYATKSYYLERFDPRESHWTILSENDYQSGYCVAVGYNNSIYKFNEFGCSKFDLRQNKWIYSAIKSIGGDIRHTCIVNNEIYAVDSACNLLRLNCENDSFIKKYKITRRPQFTPHALLFVN